MRGFRGAGHNHPFDIGYYQTNSCDFWPQGPSGGSASDGSGLYYDPGTRVLTDQSGKKITGIVTDSNGNYSTTVTNSNETDWKDTRGQIVLKVITGTNTTTYTYKDNTGTDQTITESFTSFNIKTNFACAGVSEYTGSAKLPTSISFPNGQQYSFTYEDTPGYTGYKTGRVKRVALPTGGYYEYSYPTTGNNGVNCSDGTVVDLTRAMNDGSATVSWHYVRSGSNLNVTTVTPPVLNYDSAANESTYTFTGSVGATSEKHYQGPAANGVLLRTINTTYSAGAPATITTILENNQQSKIETTFDSYGNLTVLKEHAFGSGAPGPIVRSVTMSYLSTSAYTSRNIVNRLTEAIIREGDVTTTPKFRTKINYDGGSLSSCPAGAPQHNDANYGCTFMTRGNPTSVIRYLDPATPASGITKTFQYDWFGNPTSADVNCCNKEQWAYSAATQYAFPDSLTRGSGTTQLTTSATYNAYTGLLVSNTDENSKTTTYTYDALKRLTDVQRPDNQHIQTTYDDTNKTVAVSSPVQGSDAVQQKQYFDGLGRVVKTAVLDAANASYSITEVQFDTWGRAYKTSNPHNDTAQYWTETRTDALGRPTITILPNGSTSVNNISYSYAGDSVTITDPVGKQRKQQSDALGRLVTLYEPNINNGNSLTQQTTYAYNGLDELTGVAQGVQTRSFAYDALGRVTGVTTPETKNLAFAYQYNNFDLVTQRTDARNVVTTYAYDTLNRISSISYNVTGDTGTPQTVATPTVTYTYGTSAAQNNNGRLVTLANSNASESYSYDSLGEVTQVQKLINGITYTVTYGYNLAGELNSIQYPSQYPSGRTITPGYDGIGRLSGVTDGVTNYVSGLSYNPAFQVTGFNYGNGVTASFGYLADRQQLSSLSYVKGNQTLFSLSYGYAAGPNGENNGQITSIQDAVEAGRSLTYTYDALSRLSTAQSAGSGNYAQWKMTETYDRYGNRGGQSQDIGSPPYYSQTFDATTNQISGRQYDNNGNQTFDGLYSYTFDAENHVVSLASGSSFYTYDPNGLNVRRQTAGSDTIYIFSGTKVIAEYAAGSQVASPSAEYIYAGDQMVAVLNGAGVTTFRHYDHLSARLDTDETGAVVRQFGHYPFGEVWYESVGSSKWKFTTYERDTTLDYALARHYAFSDARFVSPDPLGGDPSDPQSLNRYAYVRSDPLNATDPLGLCSDNDFQWQDPETIHVECFQPLDGGSVFSVPIFFAFGPMGCVDIYIDFEWQGNTCSGRFPILPQGGGGARGSSLTLGLRTPGQSFKQCMQQNASNYSLAGLLDFATGGNGKISNNVGVNMALGNTFTGLYFSFAGGDTAPNQVATVGGELPSVATAAMGSSLTYGRRTADIMSLNFAGKGGLPQALSSSSSGLQGAINTATAYKLAADAGFTVAEALGCLGPR